MAPEKMFQLNQWQMDCQIMMTDYYYIFLTIRKKALRWQLGGKNILYAFEAQIHIYRLKIMAVQYKVSTGHNTIITHQSYCCLNFHFLQTLYYLQDHYRYYYSHIFCDYTDVSCLTLHAVSNQQCQASCSNISDAVYDHPVWFRN